MLAGEALIQCSSFVIGNIQVIPTIPRSHHEKKVKSTTIDNGSMLNTSKIRLHRGASWHIANNASPILPHVFLSCSFVCLNLGFEF